MIDDDVISRLVELHDHIRVPATPPREDALRGERLVRRRRAASALAAGAAVVLTVGVAQVVLSGGRGSQEPAPQPSPTGPPSTGEQWTPERIRAQGTPGDPQGAIATESGLTTRLYQACGGSRCDAAGGFEDLHVAIEVTQDGRSAVFDLRRSPQPWVKGFDADSVLVQDDGLAPDQPVRYRLLQADGTAVQLEKVDDPAPAVPGPGVVVIDDWAAWNAGMGGAQDAYPVDEVARTLRPLAVPDDEIRYWGPNVEEFLWGVGDDCRVFWASDGTLEEHRLDCGDHLDFTLIYDGPFPAGWLRPGRMVVEEQSDPYSRNYLHVSLDSGSTWRRIRVQDDQSVAEVLRQID